MTRKELDAARARAALREKHPDRLEQKKAEAEQRRAEHEAHWLEQERQKYGKTKLCKPLSRMPV